MKCWLWVACAAGIVGSGTAGAQTNEPIFGTTTVAPPSLSIPAPGGNAANAAASPGAAGSLGNSTLGSAPSAGAASAPPALLPAPPTSATPSAIPSTPPAVAPAPPATTPSADPAPASPTIAVPPPSMTVAPTNPPPPATPATTQPPPSSLPPTGYQPPATGYQPPTTGYQPPTAGYQPPAAGYQPPAAGYQPPTAGYQPPTATYPAPANTYPAAANGSAPPPGGTAYPPAAYPSYGQTNPYPASGYGYSDANRPPRAMPPYTNDAAQRVPPETLSLQPSAPAATAAVAVAPSYNAPSYNPPPSPPLAAAGQPTPVNPVRPTVPVYASTPTAPTYSPPVMQPVRAAPPMAVAPTYPPCNCACANPCTSAIPSNASPIVRTLPARPQPVPTYPAYPTYPTCTAPQPSCAPVYDACRPETSNVHSVNIMDLPEPSGRTTSVEPASQDGAVRPVSATDDGERNAVQAAVANEPADAGRGSAGYFAHDPDYLWLRGRLEFSSSDARWKLRYLGPGDTPDDFGGSVILPNTKALAGHERGEIVEVRGKIKGPDPTGRGTAPEYEVQDMQRAAGR